MTVPIQTVTESGLTLTEVIAAELAAPGSDVARAVANEVRAKHDNSVLAVLYYGSCFRTHSDTDGILDLFLIVDDYCNAYTRRGLAFANAVLPPNVFYYETEIEGQIVRAKYAVISLADFARRTSLACFHSFHWARFAQPCGLLFVRDQSAQRAVIEALCAAVKTFVIRVAPELPATFAAEMLWKRGLQETYKTELRPEPPGVSARLIDADPGRYHRVTEAAAASLAFLSLDGAAFTADIDARTRWWSSQAWRLRRIHGKLNNLCRLMKAVFTFDGGVDYVLWKIERHSGVRVEPTPLLRRHPLLACWATVWRLYRKGAFR